MKQNRRQFTKQMLMAGVTLAGSTFTLAAQKAGFRFRYLVGSSMFGELPLADILPQVRRTGSEHIDIWPKHHANQREQMAEMGLEKFAALLKEHKVKLGCLTRYDLGPFRLQEELRLGSKLGNEVIVCAGRGPANLKGSELKGAVKKFAEQMQPHIAVAEETGTIIAIENHSRNLINSPDSLRWLVESASSKHLGVAFAPYHLESLGQSAADLAGLIQDLGGRIAIFYAWQHGMGCSKKLPKEQELLQMPGRGQLDFVPLVKALKKINYAGFTEIFMHPVPRGIPILPTAQEVGTEINRAREYLEKCRRPA